MGILQKTVAELVNENYVYGRALRHLGIPFYHFGSARLIDLCEERGLSEHRLIKCLYQFDSQARLPFSSFNDYPLGLILEYLKHAHHSYIKHHLPYINELIQSLPADRGLYDDLKHVFPLFVEDFIHHIYEEEDLVFRYIDVLTKIDRGTDAPVSLLWPFRSFSLKGWQEDHKDMDEMEGIRSLINESGSENLTHIVIREEINAFDRELLYHAEIENNFLLSKAIDLEDKIEQRLMLNATHN